MLQLSHAPISLSLSLSPSTTISCLTFRLFHSLSCLSATPLCSLHDCSRPHPPPLKLTSFPQFLPSLISSSATICPLTAAYIEVIVNTAVESEGQEARSDHGDKDCDRHGHMHMYEYTHMHNLRKGNAMNTHTKPAHKP